MKARKERFYFARTDQGVGLQGMDFTEEIRLRLREEAERVIQRKLDELKEEVKKGKEVKQ